MPRPRKRICLQEGLSLDLNLLARRGLVQRGEDTDVRSISWSHPAHGKIANGYVSADMSGGHEGWLRIKIGDLDQQIILVAKPRHFGGRQWYFKCPATDRAVSVIWKPSDAPRFCSRHAWGSQVAYITQFGSLIDRAHLGKARIKARFVCGNEVADSELPPKPKWMRWSTYNKQTERFQEYEEVLNSGCAALVAELSAKNVI